MATKKRDIASGGDLTWGTTPKEKAKFNADGLKYNVEGLRTAYDTYRKKGEPDSTKTEKQIRSGDTNAAERVARAGRDADSEYKRESRRGGEMWSEPNSKSQYEHEKSAGDPIANESSYEEWKKR